MGSRIPRGAPPPRPSPYTLPPPPSLRRAAHPSWEGLWNAPARCGVVPKAVQDVIHKEFCKNITKISDFDTPQTILDRAAAAAGAPFSLFGGMSL